MTGKGREWPGMDGDGRECREWLAMAGNGRGRPKTAGKGREWPEMAWDGGKWTGMAGNGQGWREMAGDVRDGRGWPMVSGIPVGLHARVLKRGALALRDFYYTST